MNNQKLKDIIKEYKKHYSTLTDIEAINERNERMQYYQGWTKERIKKMT